MYTADITVKKNAIVKLSTASVNLIAAGEVVERPAAAVKELIENSLDARAKSIDISYAHGGKTLIKIEDDGWGIPRSELKLALESHATSKLIGSNLLDINTFGFRGEALPCLAAVSKLTIKSREQNSVEGAELTVTAGIKEQVKPSAISQGTIVEVQDLFFSTPARLKFLKSDIIESKAINEIVRRIAMVNSHVRFSLRDVTKKDGSKLVFQAPFETGEKNISDRLRRIMGAEFLENSVELFQQQNGYSLQGYVSMPTYSKATSLNQYFFVNGRVVRDRLLLGALRTAYYDFINSGRHPAAVLFISCRNENVDINVHPSKSEVRFKVASDVRTLIISGVRSALSTNGLRANTSLSRATATSFLSNNHRARFPKTHNEAQNGALNEHEINFKGAQGVFQNSDLANPSTRFEKENPVSDASYILDGEAYLGAAKAQLYKNYIVAQSKTGLVIVDQHAAHERLVYERLKEMYKIRKVESQHLLLPEIVELQAGEVDIILEKETDLKALGLEIESFGENTICVRGTPAILGQLDCKALLTDILDEIVNGDESRHLEDKINSIISRIACHGSIRSGRALNNDEMNSLLRDMEKTPFSAQCNHGRPTFIELKLTDLERLFGRS